MGLRPARTMRKPDSQAWARYSKKNPKKNYIKAMPHIAIHIFDMGSKKSDYEIKLELVSKEDIRIRSNALEAARQAANKYLEKSIPGNYYLKILTYPHHVIREHKMLTMAGADRLSQGMTLAFGRPTYTAAVLRKGQTLMLLETYSKYKEIAKESLERARKKLSGNYKIKVEQIANPSTVR
ncbi:MAG: 50S ribosomal protein L16 [Candidatus Micrarchaeia archaeon]|jgi:large subunit ribosomal protein L10e